MPVVEYIYPAGGCAMAQAFNHQSLSSRPPTFMPGSDHVGFVVDKVALGQSLLHVLQFSLSISLHYGSPYSYIILGMNNMPIGGHSSETVSLH
jgi:hypothetical protein